MSILSRTNCPQNEAECVVMLKKRAAANDPSAIREIGIRRFNEGDLTLVLWNAS